MNKQASEQAIKEAPVAGSAEENSNLAGFADTEALAAAYKSLQAEFTRRSQRLKQAERKLEMLAPKAVEVIEADAAPKEESGGEALSVIPSERENEYEAFLSQFPEADAVQVVRSAVEAGDYAKGGLTRQYVRSLRAQIDALKEENNSEEILIQRARENGRVTEAIVKDYLAAVAATGRTAPPKIVGASPATPPQRPRSITEAGNLATDIFKMGLTSND